MLVRVVANAIKLGGGERSMLTIVRMLTARGHTLVWHPTTCDPFAFDPGCEIGPPFRYSTAESDLLVFLTNSTTLANHDPRRSGLSQPPVNLDDWGIARAARRAAMICNWEIGASPVLVPLFGRVAFLSTALRDDWLRLTGCNPCTTWVHAPAVDPAPFLAVRPDYDALVVCRHSNAAKWPVDAASIIATAARSRPQLRWSLMGMPSDKAGRLPPGLRRFVEPANTRSVPEFLEGASVYIYPLPPWYREQGPRVIVEAMTAGLPCMVDKRDGPLDRVARGTGWHCTTHSDYSRFLSRIPVAQIRERGEAAREHARAAFNPEDWADWLEDAAV